MRRRLFLFFYACEDGVGARLAGWCSGGFYAKLIVI